MRPCNMPICLLGYSAANCADLANKRAKQRVSARLMAKSKCSAMMIVQNRNQKFQRNACCVRARVLTGSHHHGVV